MENKKSYSKRGNPFKRGKSWTYIYYLDVDGKKTAKYKGGFATKKEAEQALKETEAQILTGQFVQDKTTPLADYLRHWFNDIHKPTIRAHTINGYRNNIEHHIIPALGAVPLGTLNRADVQKLYNSLQSDNKLSATTVLYVHRVLRKALNEAMLNGLILRNPCDGITIKKKRFQATVYNAEQIKGLLSALIGSDCELEVLLAITLGLRRGEVLGLRFQDFNFQKKTVTIRQQVTDVLDAESRKEQGKVAWGLAEVKTEKGNREIYVPQAVLDAVKKRELVVNKNKLQYGPAYKQYDLVCCWPDGEILCPQTMYHRFKRMLKTTSLPDIRFHDLRHSCASALLDMDVPLKVISDMLGHSSIKVTADIYVDVLEKKKQPAEKIQEAFFAG
jgi:integrase